VQFSEQILVLIITNNFYVMETFIVKFWSKVFELLSWISPFRWICSIFKKPTRSYFFVDVWVTTHVIFVLLLLTLSSPGSSSSFRFILILYGSLRTFEILIYQINVMFFDEYRTKNAGREYAIKGYRRLVILLLQNYLEIIFWYAFAYSTFNTSFLNNNISLNTTLQALALSFNAMTSFGLTIFQPVNMMGFFLYFSQAAIGVFMVVTILAKFIAIIPQPKSLDELEK
jgi:hypothetical protein